MSRSKWVLIPLVLSSVLTTSDTLFAQVLPVAPDARVRLSLKGKWYDDDRSSLIGIVESIAYDTVRVKLDRNSAVALVPRNSIGAIAVAAPRTRWNGARMGMGQGFLLGTIASPLATIIQLQHSNNKDVDGVFARTHIISTMSGVAFGAILGASTRSTRWVKTRRTFDADAGQR